MDVAADTVDAVADTTEATADAEAETTDLTAEIAEAMAETADLTVEPMGLTAEAHDDAILDMIALEMAADDSSAFDEVVEMESVEIAVAELAPAASVGPSVPSVPAESSVISFSPAISSAKARASSWFLPPLPVPFTVTVVSPPERRHIRSPTLSLFRV